MKKTLLSLLFFGICFITNGQELMTIREVFNFNIGDEFQITGTADNQPPNADRIKIVGKYYSQNSDTLFYIRFHNSYYTEVIWGGNPYLEYHFWTETDTAYYTNLDSSLVYYDSGFELYHYIEISSELCDSLINGCSYSIGPGYEDDHTIKEYGKGLGKTYSYYFDYQANAILWENTLFYYKKGDSECGIQDTTTVGIDEINDQQLKFTIYPNPVNSFINIKIKSQLDHTNCIIMNLKGEIILSKQLKGQQNRINIDYLDNGIYFMQIKYGNHLIIKRFIKE